MKKIITMLLFFTIFSINVINAEEIEFYWAVDGTTCDKQKGNDCVLTLSNNEIEGSHVSSGIILENYYEPNAPWGQYNKTISAVVIGKEGDIIRPKSTRNWFLFFDNLKDINFDYLDTSNVTNMYGMFDGLVINNLDLSNFDTSKVINMAQMFCNLKISELDLSSFDTSNVLYMDNMFSGSTVKTIYVSNKFVTNENTSDYNIFDETNNLVGMNNTKAVTCDKKYAAIDFIDKPGYFSFKYSLTSNYYDLSNKFIYYYDDIFDLNKIIVSDNVSKVIEDNYLKIMYDGHVIKKFEIINQNSSIFSEKIAKPSTKISLNNKKITISWDLIKNARGYNVYRSNSLNGKYKKIKTIKYANSFVDSNIEYGKKYYYKVMAFNDKYKCEGSKIVHKKVIPNKVSDFKIAQISSNSVKVSWNKLNVTGYEIQIGSNSKKFDRKAIIKNKSIINYIIKKLKSNKKYYFRIRAYSKKGSKYEYGAWSKVISDKTAPSIPNFIVENQDSTSLKIDINSTNGAINYIIYRSTGEKGEYIVLNTTDNLVYYDNELSVGTIYYYKVKACNKDNDCSAYSKVVSKKVGPHVPTQKVYYIGEGKNRVQIFMSDLENVYGYEIFRSKDKNKGFVKYKNYTIGNYFTYTYFDINTTKYYYKIRAYMMKDGNKIYSPFTSAVKPIYDETKRANDFAKLWFEYAPDTKLELYNNLQNEGFSKEIAEKTARNYKGDWVSVAKYLIKNKEYDADSLRQGWFTDEEIELAYKDL